LSHQRGVSSRSLPDQKSPGSRMRRSPYRRGNGSMGASNAGGGGGAGDDRRFQC
jgi:hypothetical protein